MIKKRNVNLFPSDVVEEFSPVSDSGSFWDSWGDLHGDSCGSSECVPVVSSGVPIVTDVSVSFLGWCAWRGFPF